MAREKDNGGRSLGDQAPPPPPRRDLVKERYAREDAALETEHAKAQRWVDQHGGTVALVRRIVRKTGTTRCVEVFRELRELRAPAGTFGVLSSELYRLRHEEAP
jgi:hypothetical protein